MRHLLRPLAATGVLLLASPALAHTGVGSTAGFAAGFGHPFGGLDHVLAMAAVGLWAAQRGGNALWLLPAAFVAAMVGGGALGVAGVELPYVELGIAASVVALGALIVARAGLPAAVCAVLCGLFAVFHGHAHGSEMPAEAAGLLYGLGFALATAILHGVGIGAGLLAGRTSPAWLARAAGGAVAAAGVFLLIA